MRKCRCKLSDNNDFFYLLDLSEFFVMKLVIFGDGICLNKFISDLGYCFCCEVDVYIGEGVVMVNGSVVGLGIWVMFGDIVKVGW